MPFRISIRHPYFCHQFASTSHTHTTTSTTTTTSLTHVSLGAKSRWTHLTRRRRTRTARRIYQNTWFPGSLPAPVGHLPVRLRSPPAVAVRFARFAVIFCEFGCDLCLFLRDWRIFPKKKSTKAKKIKKVECEKQEKSEGF